MAKTCPHRKPGLSRGLALLADGDASFPESGLGLKINTGSHCWLLTPQPLLEDAALCFAGFVPIITSLSSPEQLNDHPGVLPHSEEGRPPGPSMDSGPNTSLLLKFSLDWGQYPWGHVQFAKVTETEKSKGDCGVRRRERKSLEHPPANGGDTRDVGSIPGSGRSPGGGNGNPLQYSCLENSKDRGPWQAAVHGVAELDMTEHIHTQLECNIKVHF